MEVVSANATPTVTPAFNFTQSSSLVGVTSTATSPVWSPWTAQTQLIVILVAVLVSLLALVITGVCLVRRHIRRLRCAQSKAEPVHLHRPGRALTSPPPAPCSDASLALKFSPIIRRANASDSAHVYEVEPGTQPHIYEAGPATGTRSCDVTPDHLYEMEPTLQAVADGPPQSDHTNVSSEDYEIMCPKHAYPHAHANANLEPTYDYSHHDNPEPIYDYSHLAPAPGSSLHDYADLDYADLDEAEPAPCPIHVQC